MDTLHILDGDILLLPSKDIFIEKGSLIIIAEVRESKTSESLYRKVIKEFKEGDRIPIIKTENNIFLYIRALDETIIKDYQFETQAELNQCENNILLSLIDLHISNSKSQELKLKNIKSLNELINLLLLIETEYQKSRILSQGNNDLESSLLDTLDYNDKLVSKNKQSGDNNINFFHQCLSFFSSESESPLPSNNLSFNPKNFDDLQYLLNKYSLVAREIELNDQSFSNDCGDLLLFLEGHDDCPVAMKSCSNGYLILNPLSSEIPFRIYKVGDINIRFNSRAYSIYPTFKPNDLTTLGLLRFSYGEPTSTQKFLLSGLFAGLLIGFILAIGKDIGASRWIFGMGFSGLLVGTTLGFLTGGFRIAVLLMFLSTLLGLIVPTFNTFITNYALPDRDFSMLIQLSFILIFSGIVRVSLEWTQNRFIQIAQQKGSFKTQIASINRLLSLPMQFFRKYTFGDLQLRFFSIDELRVEIQNLLEGGLIRASLTSIYILFMLRISVKLTFLAIIIALILIIPTVIIGLQTRPLERRQQELEGEAQSRNLEIINSVSKLRLASAEYEASRWWASSYRRIINIEMILDAKESVSQVLQSIIPNLGYLLIYIVITRLGSEALLDSNNIAPNLGQLLGFFSAFATFIGAMVSLSDLIVGSFDLPIIFERAKPILKELPEDSQDLYDPGNLSGNIKIENLRYQYNLESPFVLNNLNLSIKSGQFVALTGASGCGKSTIVKILLGFDKVIEGNIYFDGMNLNGLRKDLIRKRIGTVSQNSSIFAGNIFECIAGGRVITLEQAWEAIHMVSLTEEIQLMPMGIYTVIPEGGATLSGGQKQRLAIARALIGKPQILIFDEATSALDNPTQETITRSLESLNVTRIVIAHRLTTIKNADNIFVINNGTVVEEGNYQELINKNGLFTNLVKRQIA